MWGQTFCRHLVSCDVQPISNTCWCLPSLCIAYSGIYFNVRGTQCYGEASSSGQMCWTSCSAWTCMVTDLAMHYNSPLKVWMAAQPTGLYTIACLKASYANRPTEIIIFCVEYSQTSSVTIGIRVLRRRVCYILYYLEKRDNTPWDYMHRTDWLHVFYI